MADQPPTLNSNPSLSEPDTLNPQSNQPDPIPPPPPPPPPPPQSSMSTPLSTPIPVNPTSNASPLASAPPPPPPPQAPQVSYAPPQVSGGAAVPPAPPSFRPVPQFSPMPNPGLTNFNYQNPGGVQPPGVSVAPGAVSGGIGASPMAVPQPMLPYQLPPGQPPRPYPSPMPNGYPGVPHHGTIPPPGLPRYPSPYTPMVRPPFPPRLPGGIGMLPAMSRPPIPGVPGVRPIIPPIVRPIIPSVTPAEKQQTTVYVGKIASSVENDFILSLLQLCGPVKSWKRAQDPTDGTPKGFGFCEFESAEGVLRALRLLSKFNIDGQELVLNVNQATKEYLERYVDKKTENSKKLKDAEAAETEKDDETAANVESNEHLKSSVEDSNKEENVLGSKENNDFANFGIVTNEDKEVDREALEKLTSMVEERLKTRPLPPPPPQAIGDGSGNSNSEVPAKSRDGDSEMRNDAAEDKNDDETTSETKPASEHDRPETSSPDRSRRYDRRSRDRDRERDMKREKEREIERYERETERERVRKEREQRRKIEEAERQYEECLKEWEYREREKEKQRQYEKEREKERERKRKKEIKYDEDDEDDDSRRRWRRSMLEDKRKKRLREKEDDLADRHKEEEEIVEAKRRDEEEQKQKLQIDALRVSSNNLLNESVKTVLSEASSAEIKDNLVEHGYEGDSACESHMGERIVQNGIGEESTISSIAASETRHTGNAPAKKLGFGLVGSGKRTAVPSVFHEEEDDDAHKDKKMRPLVPIDYSTEELQAVQPVSGAPSPNLAAAAEFAKRISNFNPKEDKPDAERERSRRSNEKSSQRDRDRGDENVNRTKDENRERNLDRDRDRDQGLDRSKTPDNKKLLSLKQLIDMIPKTKEELFSYEINWAVYDKHELHERMRPWISKKITEFLGEEETTLVDYIVSSTQEHMKASQMLELLQSILDEEAEMFVLKMWRMLIYEIKRVETGVASK
ncbi:hypothetical protein F2P56_030266 [Juglans regia]|uniref:RNA-binding protein 25 isoform X1 n=2 Tax=Juglans regia TaxID=51240 RepID=A0A2I4H5K2_JUGRE|nr:RNA-binding protein 25 isoform X1 [Juglans regia]KAF5449864.1 hypothetical protein F2P56_030266 [Juglans regia]